MSLVVDAIEAPTAAHAHIHCLSDGSSPVTLLELGRIARRTGKSLLSLAGRDGTVAALLTGTHDCLAVILGALRSGLTLVSLPHPGRGMSGEEYLSQLAAMCDLTHATHLLCDPALVQLLSDAPVPVLAYNDLPTPGATVSESEGRLVQFTSGSTGAPRGIELSLDAIDANLASMYDWLTPRDGAVVCSWLPLSHDMGLIGLVLYALCSVNPPWSSPSDLVLMTPEWFLADPVRWMRACTDYGATTTTAPPFALRLAARSLRTPGRFDLSTLRSFVVGSEPVPPAVLREFEQIAQSFGLPPTVLSPGYGMAEAVLAVAIDPVTRPWSSVRLDSAAYGASEWLESENGTTELVSCGPPVLNTDVRIAGNAEFGELELRSPSLLTRYVGGASAPFADDGWLHTADLACIRNGEVYVAGRTDDILIVAGRNLDARALDTVASLHPTCRAGNAACVPDGSGRYVVLLEPSSAEADLSTLRSGAREIRAELSRRFSAAPSSIVFIERGTLSKTPSGKVRRNHLHALWSDGKLKTVTTG